jgi:DNA-directed RNA polymerase subunit RPC12/RpoP
MQPIHKTELVCPDCKKPFAMIVNILKVTLVCQCKACGHRWSAKAPGTNRIERDAH